MTESHVITLFNDSHVITVFNDRKSYYHSVQCQKVMLLQGPMTESHVITVSNDRKSCYHSDS